MTCINKTSIRLSATLFPLFLGTLAAALVAACSSSESSDSPPPQDGSDASIPPDSSTGPDALESGHPWDDAPYTPQLPEGWEWYREWPFPGCLYMVPGQRGQLPAPLQWEPCPPELVGSLDCKQIKPTWTHGEEPFLDRDYNHFSIEPGTGRPLLAITRHNLEGHGEWMDCLVSEVDGPVRFAFRTQASLTEGCELWMESMNEGKVVLRAGGNFGLSTEPSDSPRPEGFIAGSIDDRHPPLVLTGTTTPQSIWGRAGVVSQNWYFEADGINFIARDWTFRHATGFSSAIEGLDGSGDIRTGLYPYQNALFIAARTYGEAYIHVWTPDAGTQPLLRWPSNPPRAAANFGTDGHDMVWTYAENRPENYGYTGFEDFWVVTSPYTTDSNQALSQARTLRREFTMETLIGPPDMDYKVGCGYASRITWGKKLFIIRLSDGYSWLYPSVLSRGPWWHKVLGLTCDEVFVTIETGDRGPDVARIKLSSLGEPILPDQDVTATDGGVEAGR